jgi:hypothetical protein
MAGEKRYGGRATFNNSPMIDEDDDEARGGLFPT